MGQPDRSRRYFENLDAIRFFSFLAVFISHAVSLPGNEAAGFAQPGSLAHLGRLGVDCFFVLSAFLITWLALDERGATNGFRLDYFFVRRILRIWPLYFLLVFLALAGVAAQKTAGLEPSTLPPVVYLVTFTLNFFIAEHGHAFLFFLVFLWSIAVEEQFYVLWGILFRFFHRAFVPVCLLLMAGSVVFRMVYFPDSNVLYFHSLSVAADFALGALLAHQANSNGAVARRLAGAGRYFWISCYVALALSLWFYESLFHSQLAVSIERLWFGLLFTLIIAEQCFAKHPVCRLGRWKAVNYLGLISYGLYCYHGLVLTVVSRLGPGNWISSLPPGILPGIVFLFTTFAAMASYRFFERPFLAWKRKFYPPE